MSEPLMSGRDTNLSYNTELNCHIANVCSGYTKLPFPSFKVKTLIDSAAYWRENAVFQDDRTEKSYLARAEALQAAAIDLSYKLTDSHDDIDGD